MNTHFANIIKRILAEQGEAILGDPARLRLLVKNRAQNIPQDERGAFGRCIEAGHYRRIQAAHTFVERQRAKAELARQLQNATGMNAALCTGALDLLDAVVPLQAVQSPRPAASAAPAGTTGSLAEKLTRKTLIFGAAGGAGAFVGEWVSSESRTEINFSHVLGTHVLEIAFWAALLSLGISIALLAAQHFIQHKRPDLKQILPTTLLGIATGTAAGGAAQWVFNYTQQISPLVKSTSNALCWGLFGAGLGLGVALFTPNYPRKRAILAGFLGGTLGGAIYVALMSSETNTGGFIGVVVLGGATGLAISFMEEALREAWLTVIWGPKETSTLSLGQKPIVFGSTSGADVYLPRKGNAPALPVRAVISIENGEIILEDKSTRQRDILRNGSEITLDRLRIVVNARFARHKARAASPPPASPVKLSGTWHWLGACVLAMIIFRLFGVAGGLATFGSYKLLKPRLGTWVATLVSAAIGIGVAVALGALMTATSGGLAIPSARSALRFPLAQYAV